ncbi:hypothetical protein AGMMS50262_06380 [Bacteroidia bacterium]|nr:hypothetical protein AGMMS50262_06380 [Bacteroidia bacterium]
MEREYNLSTLISEIRTDLTELVYTKTEYFRLEIFEKTSKVGSFLIYGLVILNIVFFALLFCFIALGYLFGEWVHNVPGGFAIVVAIYLVLLVVLLLMRKSLLAGLQNLFLKELEPDLEDEIKYEAKRKR